MAGGTRIEGPEAGVLAPHVMATQPIEYWMSILRCHHIVLESDGVRHSALSQRAVGGIHLAQISAGTPRVVCSADRLAAADTDHFLLAVQRSGRCSVRQDERVAELACGDVAFFANSRPYALASDGASVQTVLVLPGMALRTLCPGIDHLSATTFDGRDPMVRLLALTAEYYLNIPFNNMPEQVAEHANNALTSALAACVAVWAVPDVAQRSTLVRFHLARIREYALARLADPALSVAQVGAALSISPAHVHRIFALEELTFSAWLWECRLQASRTALRQPKFAHLLIGQIAERFGFSHAAHFSRAYRTRFGITPRDWRQQRSVADGLSSPASSA